MKNVSGVPQLFLRLALAIIFILAVMDRFGKLGAPGAKDVSWGDWKHFVDYTHTLVPFVSRPIANFLAVLATVAETTIAICLTMGLKIKQIALGAAILTLCFGLCMGIFVGIAAPFNYPVFVFTGSALVLSGLNRYRWSIDDYFAGKRV